MQVFKSLIPVTVLADPIVNLEQAMLSVSESQSSLSVCAELSNVLPAGSSTTFPIEVTFSFTDDTATAGKFPTH